MADCPPNASAMFGDSDDPMEIAERFETYKSELNKSTANPRPLPGSRREQNSVEALQKALGSADVSKALSPELVDSVRNALAQSDVGKAGAAEWTTTNPVPQGLAAFDLEAPAKLLAPRPTPLRNRLPRRRGVGLAHRFKRITGFTGTGTGGVGIFFPGITEGGTVAGGSQFTQGGWTPLRGSTIQYAGDDQVIPYKQYSVSDTVAWDAQFAGQGYQDVRQLSQTALLWSSMLLEERMLLGARGTDSAFAGAIVPTITLAVGATSGGITNTITTNVWVQVVAHGIWGTSAITTNASVAAATNDTIVVTFTNANTSGALSHDIYWGTGASAPAATSMFFVANTTSSTYTLSGALPASGTNASTAPSSDTTAYATGYDGLLTYCTGANSGYVSHVNGTLSTMNPGNEFNLAFASLYDSVKASPDEILANGHDRKQLSDTLKSNSGNSYRIMVDSASQAHNAQIGALVTGVQNEVTGDMVDVTVHPWLPQGTMPIISWTLPLPDSNVSDCFAVYNVQDYMGIEWPVNQFLYESSSYWYGTFVAYAPAWSGAVMGITAT